MVASAFFASQNYVSVIAQGGVDDLSIEVLGFVISGFVSALLTPFLLFAAERAPVTRASILKPLLRLLGPAVLFGVLPSLFDAWTPVIFDELPVSREEFVAIAVATFHPHFLLAACIITVANLLRARRENAAQRIRESLIERDLSRARLQLLQAEMQPHFLFNTLNAAAALLATDRARAATTVLTLAGLLETSQELGRRTSIPVATEVAFTESYLALQKVRFADRLHVQFAVDPAAWNLAVPSLILQPLVENAVLHGILGRPDGGTVTVCIFRDGHHLRMEVRDDGPGAGPVQLSSKRGLGVSNTRSRLECLFKDDFDLQFFRAAGEFVARVIVPAVNCEG